MEKAKPKIRQVRRYASHIRGFSPGIDDAVEYLETSIEFDANGNTIKETKYLQDGSPEEVSSYLYDDGNRLLEHTLEYVPDEASEKRVIERDGDGRIVRETKFYGDMAGEHTDYAYEEDRIASIRSYDEEGDFQAREEIRYNEKKLPVARISYDKNDVVQERREYTHSDDGLSVEEKVIDAKGNLQRSSVTQLNANKKETQTVEKTGQGKLMSAIQSTYDEKGNLTERIIRDAFSKRHVFTYDDQDRCVEEALYGEGGILMRRNQFEFDENGRLLSEQNYVIDVTRGGRDKHLAIRYDYDYFPS